MSLQVIASPDGPDPVGLRCLPGAVHDLSAVRIWSIVCELAADGLIVLADKGYLGGGRHILTPYRSRNMPASRKAATRPMRAPGAPAERANVQLKAQRILRKLNRFNRRHESAKADSRSQRTDFGKPLRESFGAAGLTLMPRLRVNIRLLRLHHGQYLLKTPRTQGLLPPGGHARWTQSHPEPSRGGRP